MNIRDLCALLEQADRLEEVPEEPPAAYGEPMDPEERPVGPAPLDVRKLYTLAQKKADLAVELADEYDSNVGPDTSGLHAAHRRSWEIEMLEYAAEVLLLDEFVQVTGGEGAVRVRAGWQAAWDSTPIDDETLEDEEIRSVNGTQRLLN